MERALGLESVRGILALTVFVAHCWMAYVGAANGDVRTDTHVAWMIAGRMAVVFFFVVSGYVIAMSIDRNRKRHGRFDATDYALSRVFRIVPPLLFVVFITWALYHALLIDGSIYVGWQSAERSVFVTNPEQQLLSLGTLTISGSLLGDGLNGPLWSLAYEIRLYVIAGLVALIASGRYWAALLLAVYLWALPQISLRQWAMYGAFGFGAMAYLLRGRRLVPPALLSLGVLFALLVPLLPFRGKLDSQAWLLAQLLAAGWFAGLVVYVSRSDRFGALQRLGGMSYTLYILHFPLLQAPFFVMFNHKREWLTGDAAQWTAVVIGLVVFAVCALVARWVEQPKAQRRWVSGRLKHLRTNRGTGDLTVSVGVRDSR